MNRTPAQRLVFMGRVFATAVLLAAIVWFPESVNGADYLLYGGVWLATWWLLKA